MTAEVLRNIVENAEEIGNLQQVNFDRLQNITGSNGKAFEFDKPIQSTPISLSQLNIRIAGLVSLLQSLRDNSDLVLVPFQTLNNLRNNSAQLRKVEEAIQDGLGNIEKQNGPGNLDSTNFTLQSKNGQANLNLGTFGKQLYDHCDTALQQYYFLAIPIKGEGYYDFSSIFSQLSKKCEEAQKAQREVQSLLEKANSQVRELTQIQKKVGEISAEADRLKSETEKDRKSVQEYTAETTQNTEKVRQTSEGAEKLKASVDAYKAQFENFQAQLQEREKTFVEGKKEQDRLLKSLNDIEAEITRLNERAEDMLSGATVAGLASSFGDIRNKLTTELRWARGGFYVAIGILFISAIPLAEYVIPGLGELIRLPNIGPNLADASASQVIGQIVVRAILLLPGAWLARFTAARHGALFRLKEHYSYKYSIATSVDGFKKQAESYKDDIAAAAFFELTMNPATTMDRHANEERHPNPALNKLMEKMGATADGRTS